jgi:hypothetical protein
MGGFDPFQCFDLVEGLIYSRLYFLGFSNKKNN